MRFLKLFFEQSNSEKGESTMKSNAVTRFHHGHPRVVSAFEVPVLADPPRFTGIDRLFDVLLDGLSVRGPVANAAAASVSRPVLDIRKEEKQYVVDVEIPGIDEKDIKVEINDNELTISGEKRSEYNSSAEDAAATGLYSERVYGTFTRVLTLPDDVDEAAIKADHKNGVLTITLPRKVQEQSTRSITVNKQ
jgi:HSP20 family protein